MTSGTVAEDYGSTVAPALNPAGRERELKSGGTEARLDAARLARPTESDPLLAAVVDRAAA